MAVKILVIIVTHNGKDLAPKAIEKLYGCPDIHLLIIDNNSEDETVKILKERFPGLQIIRNEKNIGFGAANNIGIRYALKNNYSYIYLLNQDAWIEADDLRKLIDVAEPNPEYGIISPLQVYAGAQSLDKNFSRCLPKELLDALLLSGGDTKDIYEVKDKTLQAAHWIVSTEALRTVGGFSPSFFHWGEDTNLCQRMEFYGYKTGIAPKIWGVHDREKREKTSFISKQFRLAAWKLATSDPNFTLGRALRKTSMLMYDCLIFRPKWFLPLFSNYISQFPKLRRNRKISIKETGAFL